MRVKLMRCGAPASKSSRAVEPDPAPRTRLDFFGEDPSTVFDYPVSYYSFKTITFSSATISYLHINNIILLYYSYNIYMPFTHESGMQTSCAVPSLLASHGPVSRQHGRSVPAQVPRFPVTLYFRLCKIAVSHFVRGLILIFSTSSIGRCPWLLLEQQLRQKSAITRLNDFSPPCA